MRYPARTAIKVILDNHSATHLQRDHAWLAAQPACRFEFTFTTQHGSWLNLIEGFFSKFARSVCATSASAQSTSSSSVSWPLSKTSNRRPVIHTWSYKLDDAA